MRKMILGSLMVLFSITSFADDPIPEAAIQGQQEDQATCIQQRANDCISKCDNSAEGNCNQVCYEVATNECKQAGE